MRQKFENYLRTIALNIRRERELDLNRRGFIAASLGFLIVTFLSSIPFTARAFRRELQEQMPAMKIAGLEELKVGDSKPFAYPHENEPALLIRLTEQEYRCYHIKCTHLGCPVYWDREAGNMACPCHNGFFDVRDGSVLAGPPQRALPAVKLMLRKDGIYAVGMVPAEAHQGV